MGVILPLLAVLSAGGPRDQQAPITALAFAPDGQSLVVASQQGVAVRTWPGLAVVRQVKTDLAQVHDLAFSPDGTRLAIAGGAPAESGGVEVLRWPGGERLYAADGHSDVVYAVAWSPDGTLVASAALDGLVAVRGADDGEALDWLEGHSRGVKAVTFLVDTSLLVTGGLDQTLRVWNVSALMNDSAKDGAPNGSAANNPEPTLRAPSDAVRGVAWLEDSARKVRARSDRLGTARAPMVRALGDAQAILSTPGDDSPKARAMMVRALTNHTAAVHDLALRPPAAGADRPALPLVASVSEDRTVRLWQPTIGRMVRFARLPDAVPLAVRWTVNGTRLVVACTDGRVCVVDPDTAAVIAQIEAIDGWAYSLAVHPDGKEIAVGGERGQLTRVRLPLDH